MRSFILLCLFALGLARPIPSSQDPIDIKITSTFITDIKKRVGLSNLNYADSDRRRSPGYKPFNDVMSKMNPGILRFPGGLEASSYLWASAPSWIPSSHAPAFINSSRWPNNMPSIVQNNTFIDVMNFDEFMVIANNTNAEVTIVINFESMYTPDGPTKEILLETARQWVIYCKKMNYTNVKYWEIGNESDMPSTYNGRPADALVYANDAADFIRVMKQEDSSILVGINGSNKTFIMEMLNIVGELSDFFVIHEYPLWRFSDGYLNYVNDDDSYDNKYDDLMTMIEFSNMSRSKKDSMFVMNTETNAIDWSFIKNNDGWGGNDVGHGIALFDLIGKSMILSRIKGVLIWTTHWVDAPSNITDNYVILTETNDYMATAYGVLPWSHAGDGRMLDVIYTSEKIRVYALENENGTVILISNIMNYEVHINLAIEQQKNISSIYVYHGETDTSTTFSIIEMPHTIPTTLLPLSITVIRMDNESMPVL
ncbi:hypothetical protein PBCVMA1D_479R [Paramecium bursaria Chlorella virus MA1D]|uniref:hypothetical protein n=1 Tax=Paramecium bursaria Chlorella virus AR158 TaxID=380598 RepID=UPI00015AA7E5|nr:hypothetical protein AR158_c134L [Paramecium bursaria Chlorella virus AR158]ABU43680.1 hypothetical protein AR158_c134L [Paramecium bursaria Chlorella virus AR158]AGE54939.1 hypothetical protein PBCVMA1D_479R [Paramecium bursaria Chlorella virus MA1D]